jgi:hypothetical protein
MLLATIATASIAQSSQKPSGKGSSQVVDSGVFSVFVGGRKLATETFSIKQTNEGSVASSQFKSDDGRASQTAELSLGPSGELRRYEWKELSPGKGQTVVEPQNEFLIERTTSSNDKPFEQPFLMPNTTMVLDDYFFSQRQILAWKYLATGCKPSQGQTSCLLGKTQFGIVIPRQRTSSMVTLEYAGKEKVTIRGAERELDRINLTSDLTGNWAMWFDGQHKLVRVVIDGQNTEVLRD